MDPEEGRGRIVDRLQFQICRRRQRFSHLKSLVTKFVQEPRSPIRTLTPLRYQAGYLDPAVRTIRIRIRKLIL